MKALTVNISNTTPNFEDQASNVSMLVQIIEINALVKSYTGSIVGLTGMGLGVLDSYFVIK